MLKVSALYIYPIKSLGGIELQQAEVTDRGLKYDRRWLLVDSDNRFMTQRDYAVMALLKVALMPEGLLITHTPDADTIVIPFEPHTDDKFDVTIWESTCLAVRVSDEADAWFSRVLKMPCKMVYMPEDTRRKVDPRYAHHGEITTFADDYPFLLIGEQSLIDLNSRLKEPLPMNRFRPNIVFSGGEPYAEDIINDFTINHIGFQGVKLCARCVMTTIDQETGVKNKEPLKTLSGYRRKDKKILFGQNVIHRGTGIISVGDQLTNISLHNEERFMV
ncbi:MOSC domain-containing protein [Mucilaginibacter sp. UR6-1]|uniref:MOSC domain-containing protein n=1 Tax=Mucilaginibacter sp. UR6-1 TaxID=1435643 RepID=UPI001E5E03A7|nr:MOSC N-terminal beta barrel domain-containing protein [Mucilaginibacter sp. UR6-1]MCC8408023.1 MOSC domain-containing protein [Mucilaginibacter sp. UR6-1]